MNEKNFEIPEDFNLEEALDEMGYIKKDDMQYEEDRIKRELTPAEEFISKEKETEIVRKHMEAGYAIGAMFKILIQSGMKYDDAVAITANYNQLVVGDNIVSKSSSI